MEEELTGKGVDLPPEIMHDILSRLPAKPLCRFKLVSKSWLSLISNPNFLAMHAKAVETNQSLLFQRRRVLFSGSSCHYSLDLDRFLSDVYASVITRVRFHRTLILTVSCNGLLLMETMSSSNSDSELYLVNPLDMRPKQLPWSFKGPIRSNDSFGLGFDYSNNKHKVVHKEKIISGFAFNVHTPETDSWRRVARLSLFSKITGFEGVYLYEDIREGVFVNGGVHWLVNWFENDGDDASNNTCVNNVLVENKETGDIRIFSADGPLIVGFMIAKENVTMRIVT